MCGIAAIIYPKQESTFEIAQMLRQIKHRGDSDPAYTCFGDSILGIVRLKIVDIENGDQPFYNEDKTVGVVFNGEIYNYKSLQNDLISKSHILKTDCDSEILVHLYEEYGKSFLYKLEGMFSFIIYDKKENDFWAVRDFFGVKPLFYAKSDSTYYFASELKAFDNLEVLEYHEIPPGHYLTSKGLCKYYQLPQFVPTPDNLSDISKKVRTLLERAVEKRVQTNLPVAVFMGGGIDSVIVNLLACKFHPNVTSLIVGLENSQDVIFAKRLCYDFNLKHHYIPITENELIAFIPDIVRSIETFEPNLIRGSVLSNILAQNANKLGFKVVLCGEGSDEIFGGYGDFLHVSNTNDFQSLLYRYLTDLYRTQLLRIDRTGMRYGVEIREPFLDRELVEYALNIPPSMKISRLLDGRFTTKFILREAFKELLPDYIYSRDKQTMMDGAGIGEVDKNKGLLYRNAETKISDSELVHFQIDYPEYHLNTKEEVLNFSYFKEYYLKASFCKKRVNNAQFEITKSTQCQLT
ncbi:MAG: asparagine synthase-related protein [Rikenellaceae bacterium]|nr:asparagine synthase-related protein [Rikenellaceae bacterium]